MCQVGWILLLDGPRGPSMAETMPPPSLHPTDSPHMPHFPLASTSTAGKLQLKLAQR